MDAEHIRELFSQFKSVEVRRMFGGVGISAEGLTFAIAFEGVIYLRANSDMVPDLKELGSKPFVYPYAKHPRTRKNPDAAPFWKMPEHLYDDPVEAARWAQRSLDAARAKKTGKAKTAPRRPRSRKAVLARKSTGRKSRAKGTRPKSAARKAAPKQRTTGNRARRR